MTPPGTDLPTADATGRLVAAATEIAPRAASSTRAPEAIVTVGPLPNTLLLRHPDPARGPDEEALADAHATARRDALERLAGWLPDLPVEQLADRPGGTGPVVAPIDRSLTDALDLTELADRLLAEHNMGAPKLIVAADGRPEHQLPPDSAVAPPVGRFDHPHALAGPIGALLAEGTTVVIHAVHFHDRTLADLAESLSLALGTQVGANLYLGRADAPGFGPHWDDHDVLIVQGEGTKHWQIFEPTEEAPVRPVVADEVGSTVAWEGTLAAGQALYIPRGWGHRVSGTDDLSMHATLTLQRLRFDQVAGFAAGMGGFWPLFRADVPYDRYARVASYAGSLYDEPGRFTAAVAELGRASALEHGTAQWFAKLPQRRTGRLSTAVAALRRTDWSDVVVRGSFPGGVVVVDEKADPRTLADVRAGVGTGNEGRHEADAPGGARRTILAAGGRLIDLHEWALPAMARLIEGRPVRVGDLPIGTTPDADEANPSARSQLVSALVSLGIIDVVSAG